MEEEPEKSENTIGSNGESSTGYLSWNIARFMKAPAKTLYLYPAFAIMFLLVATLVGSFFISISPAIPMIGILTPKEAFTIHAGAGGILRSTLLKTGDFIVAGAQYGVLNNGEIVSAPHSGVLVRKLVLEGAGVREGDPVAVLIKGAEEWLIRARINSERLPELRRGQHAKLRLLAQKDNGLGHMTGEILDWAESGTGMLEIELRANLDAKQRKIISQKPESFYGASVDVRLLGVPKQISSFFSEAIFGPARAQP
jgi:hypothetical protein